MDVRSHSQLPVEPIIEIAKPSSSYHFPLYKELFNNDRGMIESFHHTESFVIYQTRFSNTRKQKNNEWPMTTHCLIHKRGDVDDAWTLPILEHAYITSLRNDQLFIIRFIGDRFIAVLYDLWQREAYSVDSDRLTVLLHWCSVKLIDENKIFIQYLYRNRLFFYELQREKNQRFQKVWDLNGFLGNNKKQYDDFRCAFLLPDKKNIFYLKTRDRFFNRRDFKKPIKGATTDLVVSDLPTKFDLELLDFTRRDYYEDTHAYVVIKSLFFGRGVDVHYQFSANSKHFVLSYRLPDDSKSIYHICTVLPNGIWCKVKILHPDLHNLSKFKNLKWFQDELILHHPLRIYVLKINERAEAFLTHIFIQPRIFSVRAVTQYGSLIGFDRHGAAQEFSISENSLQSILMNTRNILNWPNEVFEILKSYYSDPPITEVNRRPYGYIHPALRAYQEFHQRSIFKVMEDYFAGKLELDQVRERNSIDDLRELQQTARDLMEKFERVPLTFKEMIFIGVQFYYDHDLESAINFFNKAAMEPGGESTARVWINRISRKRADLEIDSVQKEALQRDQYDELLPLAIVISNEISVVYFQFGLMEPDPARKDFIHKLAIFFGSIRALELQVGTREKVLKLDYLKQALAKGSHVALGTLKEIGFFARFNPAKYTGTDHDLKTVQVRDNIVYDHKTMNDDLLQQMGKNMGIEINHNK